MAFQTSPGINISEIDLTNSTPAVGTTEGAIAGVFRWGPTNERVLVTSEQQLVARFGAPSTRYTNATYTDANLWTNHETFLTAANFLSYSDALFVTRVTDGGVKASNGADDFTAKYEGELGNSIDVSHCVNGSFASASGDGTATIASGSTAITFKGFSSLANAQAMKRGEKITVNGQDLFLAADPVPSGGTGSDDNVFQSGAAPTTIQQSGTTDSDGGVIIHEAGDTTGTSIVQIASNTESYAAGSPFVYSINGFGGLTGLVDGKTYFAIPVGLVEKTFLHDSITDADDTITITGHGFANGDVVVYNEGSSALANLVDGTKYFVVYVDANKFKLSASNPTLGNVTPLDLTDSGSAEDYKLVNIGKPVTGQTRLYKLADTYAKAIAYTDANQTNVQITALPANAAATNKLTAFTAVESTGTVTSRYTGLNDATGVVYTKQWGDSVLFDAEPDANNVHIVVKDLDGKLTGTKGSVVEIYENVSTLPDQKKADGTTNSLSELLVSVSNWLSITPVGAGNLSSNSSGTSLTATSGSDGNDEASAALSALSAGYDLYRDPADVDISFVLQGKARSGVTLANYIINNIAEVRRDCVAFISPELSDNTVDAIVNFASTLSGSTYAVVDSGYKYQYDKYADVYRYVPLNGDIAGLCARTDDLRDPWFSPAGYNRGTVKNVVKLLVNPNKSQRDILYKAKINPVITQPGQGTVLFGDKTFAPTVSAFDRINVRRLFNVLEKTIGQAAKSTLFEFNDEFTRASFINLVEPFLRDVQGRRGIYDFKVVCDATNNTPGVIDANQFVGDIYIKPARSINFIQLNFVAVRSGVEFKEIVGAA